MAYVAHAKSDGYTLLASSSAHTTTPSIYKSLSYNAAKDLIGIVPFGQLPNVMVVAPGRFKTLSDFVAFGKANPEKLTYGSAGVGAVAHLNAERFRLAAVSMPCTCHFEGRRRRLPKLSRDGSTFISRRSRPRFHSSKWAGAGVGGQHPEALALAAEHPHDRRIGLCRIRNIHSGAGYVALPGYRRTLSLRLYDETRKALNVPAVKNGLEKLGVEPMPLTSAEFDNYLKMEIRTVAALVKKIGIGQLD